MLMEESTMRSRIVVSIAVLTVGTALASVPALAQPIRHFVRGHSATTSGRVAKYSLNGPQGANQSSSSSFNKYDPSLTGGGSVGSNSMENQDGSAETR
jgi:hypothetical protein